MKPKVYVLIIKKLILKLELIKLAKIGIVWRNIFTTTLINCRRMN